MLKIDPPVPPRRLYRYRPIVDKKTLEQELSAILKSYLWCCPHTVFKDPREGMHTYTRLMFERLTEEEKKKVEALRDEIGICCFSDSKQNELMWVHYANGHGGICVEYSYHDLLDGAADDVYLVRVGYEEYEPELGVRDFGDEEYEPALGQRNFENGIYKAARRTLSHKRACWLYENEWRLLTKPEQLVERCEKGGRLTIGPKSPLKAVYLGKRMEEELKTAITADLKPSGIKVVHL